MAKFNNKFAGLLAPIFCLLLANAPGPLGAVEPGEFITNMADAPFMAKFPPYDWPSPISCSATILSREHVMLSAHCLNATMRAGIKAAGLGKFVPIDKVMPGLKSQVFINAPDIRSSDAISVPVAAFAFPPGYPFPATPFVAIDPHLWIKDYAIAKLAHKLKFTDKVLPINLVKDYPPIKPNDKRPAQILGWGGSYEFQLRIGNSSLAVDSVCADRARIYYDYYRNQRNPPIATPLTQQQLDQVVQNMTEALREGMLCTTPNPGGIEGGNGGGPVFLKIKGKFYELAVMSNTMATNGKAYTSPFVSDKYDCKWLNKLTNGAVKCKKLPKEHCSSSSSSSESGGGGSKSGGKSAGKSKNSESKESKESKSDE